MKISFIYTSVLLFCILLFSSCLKDLDTEPLDNELITSANVFDTPESYKQFLAKLYAGLALTGQKGPDGLSDINTPDEGGTQYLRGYWYLQEFPTEEAVVAWNDLTIKDLHEQDWDANDGFINPFYARIFFQIALANEFLRETNSDKLDERGVTDALRSEIEGFRAEARFLRALSYWHALDLFRNVPFVTEEDPVGGFLPKQTNAQDLFAFIESELKEIETELPTPLSNQYGRADQAAVWTVLSKLYLNAEVYLGTNRNTDCIEYCNKVINAGYSLEPNYQNLFLADNDLAAGIIFPIVFDGIFTQTWGGTTFIVHAGIGGTMDPADSGVDTGWGGTRTTSALVNKFPDVGDSLTLPTDRRAHFYTYGQNLEIEDIGTFTDGYAVTKFKNVTSTGEQGSNITHVDTDFPLFRLADVYLTYAEAVKRGGSGGDEATALTYINALRERAYGDNSGNITNADLTLDFILDERARELYWEGHRRTDLIRYGRFSETDYTWPWKGGVADGISVPAFRDIFPIPASDIGANPTLQQNPGY